MARNVTAERSSLTALPRGSASLSRRERSAGVVFRDLGSLDRSISFWAVRNWIVCSNSDSLSLARSSRSGRHAVTVGYFQPMAGRRLEVFDEGPGIDRQHVPKRALFREVTPRPGN